MSKDEVGTDAAAEDIVWRLRHLSAMSNKVKYVADALQTERGAAIEFCASEAEKRAANYEDQAGYNHDAGHTAIAEEQYIFATALRQHAEHLRSLKSLAVTDNKVGE